MTKTWGIALSALVLAAGCTFKRTNQVSLTVFVPPVSAAEKHRREDASNECVFVNVMSHAQAELAATAPTACWQPTNFSGLVWRGGSTDPIAVPMQVAPGQSQTVQVLAVVGTNVNSATCHGMPEGLASQNSVYQYGVATNVDLFAGSQVDVTYSPRPDQAVLTEGCGPSGDLQSIFLKPAVPLVTKNGQRKFHAFGNYSGGVTHELTSVTWATTPTSIASTTSNGVVSGLSLGSFTLSATVGDVSSGPINGLVTDPNMYLADYNNGLVRQITPSDGLIHLMAGIFNTFTYQASDNGRPATLVPIGKPMGVVTDRLGNIYLSDNLNNVVRRVDGDTRIITAYAGDGVPSLGGDGASATSAHLNGPHGLALNSSGDLFIADLSNGRVRIVHGPTGPAAGTIDTYETGFGNPFQLVTDSSGVLYVSDTASNTVYMVPPGGASHAPIVGMAARTCGTLPSSSPTTYPLNQPFGLALDESTSRLFIAENGGNRILVYDYSASPTIDRYAGSATCTGGSWTDGSPVSTLIGPRGLAYHAGDLYVYDTGKAAIGRIDSGMTIHLHAGVGGSSGYNGDERAANGAQIDIVDQIWLGQ